MIVIGYPGVGKSTVAKRNDVYVDFDSSMFPKKDGWEEEYVNNAIGLSKQGHIVFVSAHKKVQDLLFDCGERVVVVYPSLTLHDFWIDKLRDRYEITHSESDKRALMRCVCHYCEDILELEDSKFETKIELKRANEYDLEVELEEALKRESV